MKPDFLELLATILFTLAVVHTFSCSYFKHIANRFPEGSVKENVFHLLGEVEIVFGLWAGVLLSVMALLKGSNEAIRYAESLHFTEPLFVFVVMTVAATAPVLDITQQLIMAIGRLLPFSREVGVYFSCLVIGPLLGSFITEPAAMTVVALILKGRYFTQEVSDRFKYKTLAALFVNISIGGVLTPYAAPPVLMVARTWNWDLGFMLHTFGWKAIIATTLNAALVTFILRSELKKLSHRTYERLARPVSIGLSIIHILFPCGIVMTAHHPVIFMGLFLFFLGIVSVTPQFQDALRIKESLLVAFFLGGLVVLGGFQKWWLAPLIHQLNAFPLFIGTTALTAITDNAALTYLGSQVENVSDMFKYALVAGAVAGGGLTVIANAPNPAGYSILQETFRPDGIRPGRLFRAAMIPTLIAMASLWFLP